MSTAWSIITNPTLGVSAEVTTESLAGWLARGWTLVTALPNPLVHPGLDETVSSLVNGAGTTTGLALRQAIDNELLTHNPAVVGTGIDSIVVLTQAAYDSLPTKSSTTLYVVQG